MKLYFLILSGLFWSFALAKGYGYTFSGSHFYWLDFVMAYVFFSGIAINAEFVSRFMQKKRLNKQLIPLPKKQGMFW